MQDCVPLLSLCATNVLLIADAATAQDQIVQTVSWTYRLNLASHEQACKAKQATHDQPFKTRMKDQLVSLISIGLFLGKFRRLEFGTGIETRACIRIWWNVAGERGTMHRLG